MTSLACTTPHLRPALEEEPFVLSPGPSPSMAEALARPPGSPGGTATLAWTSSNRRVPLVHATVNGRPTLLLLDTGAYDHLLEGWFARELNDASTSGKSAAIIDHANRKVGMDAWGEVHLALDGWGSVGPMRPLVTRDVTPMPRALGIGGIFSPQKLARDDESVVVLDFPANELLSLDLARAEERLLAHPSVIGTAIRCGSGYTLGATIEAHEARLLVDTGSFVTDLKASSAPGRALAGRSAVAHDIYAVGGPVGTRVVSDAKVTMGRRESRLDVSIVQDEPLRSRCSSDGVVGMDALAACVVLIMPREMRIACD